MIEILTSSEKTTVAVGRYLGSILTDSDIVLLNGELGTGKTALVRGIVKELTGTDEAVRSPSYTYLNSYPGVFTIHHLDVYLLDSYDDLLELGFEELIGNGLILIEWGGRFAYDYQLPHWDVQIAYTEVPNQRLIKIYFPSGRDVSLKELETYATTNI